MSRWPMLAVAAENDNDRVGMAYMDMLTLNLLIIITCNKMFAKIF